MNRSKLVFSSPLSATELAALRTLLAADRTLMAWLRTSLALISFGFTIYKVLDGIMSEGVAIATSPAVAGSIMASAGTLVMLVGIADYWQTLRLAGMEAALKGHRFSLFIAMGMAAMGLAVTIGISTRAV